jgi:hypothetical protein
LSVTETPRLALGIGPMLLAASLLPVMNGLVPHSRPATAPRGSSALCWWGRW